MASQSNIVIGGSLILEDRWKAYIASIENSFDNLETNKERAKRALKEKLIEAIKKRMTGNFGICFSGGIDSTFIALVCKSLDADFTCYCVGIDNSDDIESAIKVASSLNLKLKHKVLSLEEFESTIKKVLAILKEPDVTKIGVGSVFYAAAELAAKDNVTALFSGVGSEEILAGYERHEKAFGNDDFGALHKECWNGLKNMHSRDLARDYAIAKELGIDVKTPFMDTEVIKAAMRIHPMYKLDNQNKKIILREIADDMGLQKEFSWRPKKAAQYGSNFIRGMDKLAKKHGFKLKKDYLASLVKSI